MLIVLSRDSDLQLRIHQKPFVGRAPPGPAGELTALPKPIAGLGKGLKEVYRRMGKQKGTEAKKRGYLENKGREQKGREEMNGRRKKDTEGD